MFLDHHGGNELMSHLEMSAGKGKACSFWITKAWGKEAEPNLCHSGKPWSTFFLGHFMLQLALLASEFSNRSPVLDLDTVVNCHSLDLMTSVGDSISTGLKRDISTTIFTACFKSRWRSPDREIPAQILTGVNTNKDYSVSLLSSRPSGLCIDFMPAQSLPRPVLQAFSFFFWINSSWQPPGLGSKSLRSALDRVWDWMNSISEPQLFNSLMSAAKPQVCLAVTHLKSQLSDAGASI